MEKAIIKRIKCRFDLTNGTFYHNVKLHECELNRDKSGYLYPTTNNCYYCISDFDKFDGYSGSTGYWYEYYTKDLSEKTEKNIFSKMHKLINEKCEKLKSILDKSNLSNYLEE